MKLTFISTIAVAAAALSLSACGEYVPSADQQAARQTEQLAAEAQQQVGVARVRNFFEKRLANQIIEARDNPNLSTYAYVQGIDGRLTCLGEAIGYGLPYSAQTTNPSKIVDKKSYDGSDTIMPQQEPNGLFMPESAAATWIMLIDDKGNTSPVYVEGDITVSPFKLRGPAIAANCA